MPGSVIEEEVALQLRSGGRIWWTNMGGSMVVDAWLMMVKLMVNCWWITRNDWSIDGELMVDRLIVHQWFVSS